MTARSCSGSAVEGSACGVEELSLEDEDEDDGEECSVRVGRSIRS
jgi:hypothetical protein